MTAPADPIEAYLDALADGLCERGRALRSVLAEAEDHLVSAADAHRAAGLDEQAAAAQAVADCGDPRLVARQLRAGGPRLTRALVGQAVRSLALVGGIGLVTVGLSGLLAWAAGTAFGTSFVSGDGPDVTYSAARCAELREYAPTAPTCAAAAVSHHFDEVVFQRLAAGVLGLLVLAAWLAVVRPWRAASRAPSTYAALPAGFGATVGAALFGLAAVVALPGGLLELALGGAHQGAGDLLSAGVVSTIAFAGFAAVLWRSVTHRLA
jgi:hypothetical protein